MKKKLIALLMSVISLFALFGFGACDLLGGPTQGIVYTVSADGTYAEVIGYTGTSKRVVIADTYNGVPVTTIYEAAFSCNEKITSVTLPDSITSVEKSAFNGCTELLCNEYGTTQYLGSKANKYLVLMGPTSKNIGNVEIHPQTKVISAGALSGCSRIEQITIPQSVVTIGEDAFRGCTELVSATIPSTVNTVEGGVFNYCVKLESVTFENNLTSIGERMFYRCDSLVNVTIPESVTEIGEWAFYHCDSLTDVVIPDGVVSIGGDAYGFCENLKSITIPVSVTSIGDFAVAHCEKLTDIIYQGTVEQWIGVQKGQHSFSSVGTKKVTCSNGTVDLN